MFTVHLPICKSIANRLLILQAMYGDILLSVDDTMPDDVRVLHKALDHTATTIDVGNCGTAMRFLTAYFAIKEGVEVLLTGNERMKQRPIGQLVEALQRIGADIEYKGETGFPPLLIKGQTLEPQTVTVYHPLSTQFVSALRLIGMKVQTDSHSPYIALTEYCIDHYDTLIRQPIEADWSSAAFWYEWVALHAGTDILLSGVNGLSRQGDKQAAAIFEPLGVITRYVTEGAILIGTHCMVKALDVDFSRCPDLYPAVALTCHRLGVRLTATGTERLPFKESDRLQAIKEICATLDKKDRSTQAVASTHQSLPSYADHRIAMALLAADYEADDTECIKKSYPLFAQQLQQLNQQTL
ncbi:MAG: hypothetical protein IJS00_03915 [Paludibacteraceae bacterium]|nr:hypothetical protein [Paludibacteraceae bacterium]